MRRRILHNNLLPSTASVGDICLYDKTNEERIIVNNNYLSSYPISRYIPIGVVVIPGNHNVYGDGSCGVMSLKEMNYSSPTKGSTSYKAMYWGNYGVDIPDLANLNEANHIGESDNLHDSVQGTYKFPYLPSDKFNTIVCPHDTESKYYYNNADNFSAPSPYLTDGSRNPMYYQTESPASDLNCLADFDGIGNTDILTSSTYASKQSKWETASTITNRSDSGYSPAACCCRRFSPDENSAGLWYLPACGELGYIVPRFNVIKTAIQKVIAEYGSSYAVVLSDGDYYWSSSEYSANSARYISTFRGRIYYDSKNVEIYVRAFCRIK